MDEIIGSILSNIHGILVVIILAIVIYRTVKASNSSRAGRQRKAPDDTGYSRDRVNDRVDKSRQPSTFSSDGHRIDKDEDPTCAKYGHVHENVPERYIVHDEVPEGYCILNGKKVKLKEAKDY
ncbi:MAG: hypothetical protein K6F99_11730 [Lachnospiraceae bacterium]|nr:hypothetical protein [Lachnospiraceae bacterium]